MTSERPLLGKRILVVEDDYFLASDACHSLEQAGARVVGPTPDPEEACGLIAKGELDSAVVDINLGNGANFSVVSSLTEAKVPFVFATGYDHAAIPAEFSQAPRVEKPFRGEELVRVLSGLGCIEN